MDKSIVFMNGTYLSEADASIPISDRGFLFGDGVFTTIRVEEGEIQFLDQHLKRIEKQCGELRIDPPPIKKSWLERLIQENRADSGIWRMKIIVTGGSSATLSLMQRKWGVLLITLKRCHDLPSSCSLAIYPHPVTSSLSHLKTLSYLERLRIKEFAEKHECYDAIVRSPEGYLLETAFGNLCWKVNDKVYVPDPELPMMEGIMVSTFQQRIPVKARLEEIPSGAKFFLCNALIGCISVNELKECI